MAFYLWESTVYGILPNLRCQERFVIDMGRSQVFVVHDSCNFMTTNTGTCFCNISWRDKTRNHIYKTASLINTTHQLFALWKSKMKFHIRFCNDFGWILHNWHLLTSKLKTSAMFVLWYFSLWLSYIVPCRVHCQVSVINMHILKHHSLMHHFFVTLPKPMTFGGMRHKVDL